MKGPVSAIIAAFAVLQLSMASALAEDFAVTTSAVTVRLVNRPLLTARREKLRFVDDLIAKGPVLLSFTYTGCQTICPPSDITMEAVADRLDQSGMGNVKLVTLTLDPLTDTPETLLTKRALDMNPRRMFLTGEQQDVWAVLDGLGITFGDLDQHDIAFFAIGAGGQRLQAERGLASDDVLLEALKAVQ